VETAKINVLSLFDGMSCGQIALDQSGIEVNKYYASEIDKYAIEIAKKNYPNTMHVGDVTKVDGTQLDKIDLLIGGSPCQGFSFAGKQLNFNDPRSALFFEFVRLLKETKPKYFLLENVRMKKEFQDIITEYLGVEPIIINSSLLSAQNRVRFYWTNIPNVTQPIDKGIVINDILEEAPDMSRKGGSLESYFNKHKDQPIFSKDGLCHVGNAEINGNESIKRVYHPDGKAPTLTTMQGGHREPKILCAALRGRQITKGSKEYTQMLEVRDDGKTNTLTTIQKDNVVTVDNKYYRKLSPTECERLQTAPDNYTEGVSNSQRYKMIGNGWTVAIIKHIFRGIKNETY
jgi:DNA-cytosine methyltransferase